MMASMPRDTSTRFEGVYARHRQACAIETTGDCTCDPSYWGKAYDRARGKPVKTVMLPTATAAKTARADLLRSLAAGQAPMSASPRLEDAADAFLRACRSGVCLTKHGRRYKPSAIRDLDGCLNGHALDGLGKRRRIADIRRGDVQQLVDTLTEDGMSGSRVRSVVNALRSLYRWAEDRELVQHDPAARVRLPAMDPTPRDRVATPDQAARLLASLPTLDALAYGIAAYAGARRQEIRALRVEDVDLDLGVLYLGADDQARKSRAALRPVPIASPLRALLLRAMLERGRPTTGLLVPGARGGRLSFEALQVRADDAWPDGERFTAHELRHTFATWLDAAGVRGTVRSMLLGHSTGPRDGAAAVTGRYTHALPGDLERAREQLDTYLIRESSVPTSVPTSEARS